MADEKAKPAPVDAAKWAGIGVGIGSAALVAALLYANRAKVAEVVRRARPIEHED